MIQRIQTIWLFLTSIFSLSMFLLPVTNPVFWIECILGIELGLAIVLSAIAIFLYKKRKLQIKLCYTILVLLILLYITYGICFSVYSTEMIYPSNRIVLLLGVLPFIAIIFDILAIRAIKKDEKLVRSLDRLR